MSDNIKVMIRIRPFNTREISEGSRTCNWISEEVPRTIVLDSNPKPRCFTFDWTGGSKTTQSEIFNYIGKQMVDSVFQGYNSTIFAYGQTGAGKTYTMLGKGISDDVQNSFVTDNEDRGLQPRCIEYLFWKCQQEAERNQSNEHLIKCTYIEIYNEQIIDLLNNSSGNLQLREDLKKGPYLDGITEEVTYKLEETIDLLKRGARNRHVGATQMNFESSRSHSVFSMTLESKVQDETGLCKLRTSKFHFVDQAGSERQKLTKADGDRLKEGCNINKSLSILGSVINSLVEASGGSKKVHIRYRDSKLTFLLKDSLGGNSKTAMIANISPASASYHETLSTLQFAQRAKMIKNKAQINEDSSGSVESLKREIRKLQDELESARGIIRTLEATSNDNVGKNPQGLNTSNLNNSYAMCLENLSNPNEALKKKDELFMINERAIELESLLYQSTVVLSENQIYLETELNRKENYLDIFKNAMKMYSKNEVQFRFMLKLLKQRISRFALFEKILQETSSMKLDSETKINNAFFMLTECYESEQSEKGILENLMESMPVIAKVFEENVFIKERIYQLELRLNSDSSVNVLGQLRQNLSFMQKVNRMLTESLDDRKVIRSKLERLCIEKESESEKQLNIKETMMTHLKMEFNEKMEKNNVEMVQQKFKEKHTEEELTRYKKKYKELESKVNKISCDYDKQKDSYESRIETQKQEFENLNQNKSQKIEKLKQEIDNLKLEKSKTNDDVDNNQMLSENLEKVEIECNDHMAEIAIMKDRIKDLETHLSQTNETLDDNKSKIQNYESIITDKTEEISTKTQKQQTKTAKCNDLKAGKGIYLEQILNLRNESEELTEQFGVLQQDNLCFKNQLELKDKEIDSLKIAMQENDFKNFSEHPNAMSNANSLEEITILKQEINKTEEEKNNLNTSYEYVTAQLQAEQLKNKELVDKLNVSDSKILENNTNQMQLEQDTASNQKNIESINLQTLTDLQNELEVIQNQLKVEQQSVNEFQDKERLFLENEKAFKSLNDDLQKEIHEKTEQQSILENSLNIVQNEMSELNYLNKSLNEEKQDVVEKNTRLAEEFMVLEKIQCEHENTLSNENKKLLDAQEKLNRCLTENGKLIDENSDLILKISHKDREIIDLDQRIKDLTENINQIREQSKYVTKQRNLYHKQASQFFGHLIDIRSQQEGSSDIFDDLIAAYKSKHEVQVLHKEIEKKQKKIDYLNKDMFEITSTQQNKFTNQLKKNEFIESEYNKLSKIVHIKDFEMKIVKDLAEKNEQDKNKYVEDLKKFRVGMLISNSSDEKSNFVKKAQKTECSDSDEKKGENDQNCEFAKPGDNSSDKFGNNPPEKSVENLFKTTIKKEEAIFEYQKIQSENLKMKDSVKDLLRLMNEILVKSNSEISQHDSSSYLPFLVDNNNHHFEFSNLIEATKELAGYLNNVNSKLIDNHITQNFKEEELYTIKKENSLLMEKLNFMKDLSHSDNLIVEVQNELNQYQNAMKSNFSNVMNSENPTDLKVSEYILPNNSNERPMLKNACSFQNQSQEPSKQLANKNFHRTGKKTVCNIYNSYKFDNEDENNDGPLLSKRLKQ